MQPVEAWAVDLVKWGGGLLLIASVKLLWDLNQKMGSAIGRLEAHSGRIEKLEAAMESLVTRTELLETLKRVEQQLEIMLLKSKQERSNGGN